MSITAGQTLGLLGRRGKNRYPQGLSGPWLIDMPDRNETWACATDATAIMWSKHWGMASIVPLTIEKLRAKLTSLFDPPALPHLWQGRLVDLRRSCGEPIWEVPCEACKGTSAESEYVSCSFCDNDGQMGPDARPGYVCGAPVDLNLLACTLEPFPGEALIRVIAHHREKEQSELLWVIGETFRVCVACMNPLAPGLGCGDKWANAPRLLELPAGCSS